MCYATPHNLTSRWLKMVCASVMGQNVRIKVRFHFLTGFAFFLQLAKIFSLSNNGNKSFKWHLVWILLQRVTPRVFLSCDEQIYTIFYSDDSIYTRIDGFYFFLRVFFRPPVPVRLRFTVFGDLSFVLPLMVGPFPVDPIVLGATFFTKSFDLLCRWSIPSLPFALKCCWTSSLKAPSCASIVRNVVMNSS